MKIAVVAVTKQGMVTAKKTAELLGESGGHETVLYVPGKFSLLRIEGKRMPYRKPLRTLLTELFNTYDGIVCVMALGIVVRLIAPHIKEKTTDPAVVVLDELGQNVISVLSGHWGGANALTIQIATGLGINPVITTATDIHGLPAIEMIAKENGWLVEPLDLVRRVNASIVNGEKVVIYSEAPVKIENTPNIEIRDFARFSPHSCDDSQLVLVTNRKTKNYQDGILFLRPRNLCIGIGCRRNVTTDEVKEAIMSALEETGRSLLSVRGLASIEIKSDERGLLEAARDMNLPIEFFKVDMLQKVLDSKKQPFEISEFVNKQIGVGGVCEPAAVLGAGTASKLILPKIRYNNVTIAIAEGDWR